MEVLGAHTGLGGWLCGSLAPFERQFALSGWGRTISIAENASGGVKVGLWLRTRGVVAEAAGEWSLLGCRHRKAPQRISAAL